MNPSSLRHILTAAVLLTGVGAPAQWRQQTMELRPGWNAVYLEVQPEPAGSDALFAGLPVESVWTWNRSGASAEFIQDPTQLIVGQEDWLTYLPPQHPAAGQTTLHALSGGRAYLVRILDGAAAFPWTVTGRPVLRPPAWVPDSWTLTGFAVREANPPSIRDLLAGSSAHAGQPILRLGTAGRWEPVPAANAPMRPGEAFWVRTAGASDFGGPVEVRLTDRTGLLFGGDLVEQEILIVNRSAQSRAVTVAPAASAGAPAGQTPVAGPVPLSYRVAGSGAGEPAWQPWSEALQRTLAAGETWRLRIAVRRRDLPATGGASALFQSLLVVTDAGGGRWTIPVSAARAGVAGGTALGTAQGGAATFDRAGLWVGSARIEAVNQPSHPGNPALPRPTPAVFEFRLLVHVDGEGRARLLQKVLQMHQPPTYRPDPENPGRRIVDEPGRTVLLTDDGLASQYTGSAVRDGRVVGRRLSSAAFGTGIPVLLSGGAFGTGTLTGEVVVEHDDPLNPFVHRYHPDHDNLTERFDAPLPEGRESFRVARTVTLEFTGDDPEGLPWAGWGDLHLGGRYRERIEGLHRHPLQVSGTFRLQRASAVPVLNDGR